ncbi:response regulator [Brevibacillus sp. SYSU BS000544]|uniref:response regulator n=1 Tax=Brevibacillus sp. SYSU BS000544 TaxID=3416443 RepID=UPI003CE5A553
MEKISVMIVEDDVFWQKQLATDLGKENDIDVVFIASTKEQAVEAAQLLDPDIILMDIHLTHFRYDGLEAAKEMFRTGKVSGKIIIISSESDKDVIIKAFQHGATNYLTKYCLMDILQAIREAYYDHSSIHFDVAHIIRNELRLMVLTPSEREVYDLSLKGFNKTQISESMQKSFNTIKTQWKSIKSKL